MKKISLAAVLGVVVLISGCCCSNVKSAEREAVEMIRGNQAECVIVKNNRIAVGLIPLRRRDVFLFVENTIIMYLL